jgi:hypothetical protein
MIKEKNNKASVALIVIALALGIVIGFFGRGIINNEQETFEGNLIMNPGFEQLTNSTPDYWFNAYMPAENLTMDVDTTESYSGSSSAYIKNTHIYNETVSNNWAQTILKTPIGKTIELTGYAKTVDAESVVMVIQCWDINSEMVGFGTTQSSSTINGTTDWMQYSTSVKVPTDTQKIVIRLALTGTGQVWFDDITLEVK